MKAAPTAQAALLRVVDLDNRAKAAEARKRNLPEHAELNQLNARRRQLADEAIAASTRAGDAETAMQRIEEDLTTARTRLARDQQRIDDGVVNDARSIASLQDEISHLNGRIAELEDRQLEGMVASEDDRKAAAAATAAKAEVETRMRALLASRDEAIQAADAELVGLAEQRAQVVAGLPADLVALYDKVAARAGTGAAEFKGGRCTGCGLTMDALARRAAEEAPPDEVVRCAECDRILVRPA